MYTKRINDSLKRAALYSRVSTEEQAMHGVSLDAQKERLLSYANENGLSVIDIYVDEGVSARKRYTKRPEFMRMLEDVRSHKIDVVLFIKLDRWFRNIADYYEVQAILDKYNVSWVATDEDYDTTTANGRLALNIKLAIAQDESDRTSERIKFVFQNMVKDKRIISGRIPMGYVSVDKRAVIDEEKAEIVRETFKHYIDCRSMKATARHILDKYGVNIDLSTMKRMLTNTWYIGEAYGIKDFCPPIIDEDTFNLSSSIVKVRAEKFDGTRSDRVYLFTGLIFCSSCGHRMTTYSCANKTKDGHGKIFIYYRCPGHTARVCDMEKQINQDKLEKWLLDNIKSEAEQYILQISNKRKTRVQSGNEAAKITAKIEKLKDLYLNDLIPRDMYEKDYHALTARLADLQAPKIPEKDPFDMSMFDNFTEMYENLSMESRKALWSRMINKITVSETGEFTVTFN